MLLFPKGFIRLNMYDGSIERYNVGLVARFLQQYSQGDKTFPLVVKDGYSYRYIIGSGVWMEVESVEC